MLNHPGLRAEFSLEPGQMCFVNNRWVLHNRTAFQDHPDPERRRHLVRLWLEAKNRAEPAAQCAGRRTRQRLSEIPSPPFFEKISLCITRNERHRQNGPIRRRSGFALSDLVFGWGRPYSRSIIERLGGFALSDLVFGFCRAYSRSLLGCPDVKCSARGCQYENKKQSQREALSKSVNAKPFQRRARHFFERRILYDPLVW